MSVLTNPSADNLILAYYTYLPINEPYSFHFFNNLNNNFNLKKKKKFNLLFDFNWFSMLYCVLDTEVSEWAVHITVRPGFQSAESWAFFTWP